MSVWVVFVCFLLLRAIRVARTQNMAPEFSARRSGTPDGEDVTEVDRVGDLNPQGVVNGHPESPLVVGVVLLFV